MNDIANSFLLVYAGLFPIVNPVGSAPIFLGLTRHCSDQERRALAGRVAVNGFFLLLGSPFRRRGRTQTFAVVPRGRR